MAMKYFDIPPGICKDDGTAIPAEVLRLRGKEGAFRTAGNA
jgi:hypothetical protein